MDIDVDFMLNEASLDYKKLFPHTVNLLKKMYENGFRLSSEDLFSISGADLIQLMKSNEYDLVEDKVDGSLEDLWKLVCLSVNDGFEVCYETKEAKKTSYDFRVFFQFVSA